MEALRIRPVAANVEPGDFGVEVREQVLLVPDAVINAVRSGGVRTAADFLSYLEAFPSAVAGQLHWSLPEVNRGLQKLRSQLRGHVEDTVLDPPARRTFVHGAMRPPHLGRP